MTKGINNKDWKLVSFGEMCKNLNESERDPLANGIDRYVGLEHIETNNLHINSWGNVADGTTFTKRFRNGQVLFGKRRAYLRKAAIADFDGICSGDILVFKANEKVINPDLLPFIVSSDRFFDYAIQTSAGSLSPRTKFQDLANLKFPLPPKDEQAQLAELLWASDITMESKIRLLIKLRILFNTYQFDHFQKTTKNNIHLNSIAEIIMGQSPDGKSINEKDDGVPFLQGNAEFTKTSPVSIKSTNEPTRFCKEGDVLISVRAPVGEINLADKVYCIGRGLAAVRLKKGNNLFLKYLLNSNKHELDKQSTGSTFKAINKDNLNNLLIPDFTEKEIRDITANLISIESRISSLDDEILKLKQIQKQLINQIFST